MTYKDLEMNQKMYVLMVLSIEKLHFKIVLKREQTLRHIESFVIPKIYENYEKKQ